jgi:hypothetical protein
MGVALKAGVKRRMLSLPWRRRPSAQKLIRSVEEVYYDLRRSYPERDEHWLLANTWLRRYGSTKEARRKGEGWARYVAYQETLQFSILEMPKSVRAMALFMVARELGAEEALYYASGFAALTEPIARSKENHEFLGLYRERSPRTWRENQAEADSPHSLSHLFRELERGDSRSEKAEPALD